MNQLVSSLDNLPTEIHHEIFSYLDYVRDVCAHPLLFVPIYERISSCEEMEKLMDSDEEIDFNLSNRDGPVFLTCKSFLESFKSFKPSEINLTYFESGCQAERSMFCLDSDYLDLIRPYHWFNIKERKVKKLMRTNSVELLLKFVKKIRKFCNCDVFKTVEMISISAKKGKNYVLDISINSLQGIYLEKIMKTIPNAKYYLTDFKCSPLSIILKDKLLIAMYPNNERPFSIARVGNLFSIFRTGMVSSISSSQFLDSIPNVCRRNIELLLFFRLSNGEIAEAITIIDNYDLNIDHFAYILNVYTPPDHIYNINQLFTTTTILLHIFKKYPMFKLFKFPIYNVGCWSIIKKLPFVHINVSRNITKQFIEATIDKQYINIFCEENNVDLLKLGKYQFSAACFDPMGKTKITLDHNSADLLGITPCMALIQNYENLALKHDITKRDKFGNNILHYYFTRRYGWSIHLTKIPCLSHYSESELFQLLDKNNIFGTNPSEISFSKHSSFESENFKKKPFDFINFSRACYGNDCHSLQLMFLNGLQVDMRILLATRGYLKDYYNYDEYKDAKFRDENGKHLAHYLHECFSFSSTWGTDIIYCKDINQTMPIQTSIYNYYNVLKHMAVNMIPLINFISYSDNFGMYRFMYLLVSCDNLEIVFSEFNTIAFDYSTEKPQLISLNCNFTNDLFHFSIDRTELAQLKSSPFGCIEGDDLSHWIIRHCLFLILNTSSYRHCNVYLLLSALIKRGLKLNVVKNKSGQTALDIFEEFSSSSEFNTDQLHLLPSIKIMKQYCKKGKQTKSAVLQKFILKHKSEKQLIVEESETNIIAKECPRVKIVRSLFFAETK